MRLTLIDSMRGLRLQALMARQLLNWREVWQAYSSGQFAPALRFRDGRVLHGEARDSTGFLFLEIFANGCYRRGLPRALSGVVIDIGANIGAFTLDVAKAYPSAIVHAYEPDPDTCAILRKNVAANGLGSRVQVWNEAVAGAGGILRLWRGEGSIVASAHLGSGQRATYTDVPAVPPQTVFARAASRIALLKLDCEGAEADILDAAGPELARVDYVVAEYHEHLVPGVVERMQRMLAPGFAVTVSEGRRCGPMLRATRRATAQST